MSNVGLGVTKVEWQDYTVAQWEYLHILVKYYNAAVALPRIASDNIKFGIILGMQHGKSEIFKYDMEKDIFIQTDKI